MANFRSYTVTQLNYKAARHCQVLRAGQILPADLNNDMLSEVNDMIDAWEVDRRKLFAIRPDLYPLTAGVQFYIIGPGAVPTVIGGVEYGALPGVRPVGIEDANIVVNTVTPPVRTPVRILTPEEWADIRLQSIPFALPLKLWYDANFNTVGQGTISLWPGPLSSYGLELFTTQSLGQVLGFADLTTAYSFPPGYADAVTWSLAERCGPMLRAYFKTDGEMFVEVKRQAKMARAAIESFNTPEAFMSCDPAYLENGRSSWNYSIGESWRR